MELDLRKTAADAAYIAVGAGVLGFQQAQVRRREAGERIAALARDTQTAVTEQRQAIRHRVSETTSAGLDSAASAIRGIDPRQWVEPVIEDLRSRVAPAVEQLKDLDVTSSVQALPEQLNRAVERGRTRVQSRRAPVTAN